ncbi:MAG: DUF4062 domain-containing protein [Halarcobacter ebronensis]|uniref:DUF4062 domain-containing protein n=1 Tax=Halarcobacter ebronensis TaxID=1462615 RepID=UPI003C765B1D
MAIPRVFVSSTCYDLKHIRENLKFFIKSIGYEPVLSDEGDVFYSPYNHTHESCLKEVESCQLFILVIGGRYGGKYKDSDKSITNSEYKEAVKQNIPIFTLVERGVYSDHHLYGKNKKDNPDIYKNITYPNIDDIKIFDFIDEVRRTTKNNAIHPFQNFSDMESYIKKQWAGMMYDFLIEKNRESESKLTNKLLDDISLASRKTEELVKFLLSQTNSNKNEVNKEIDDINNKIEAEKFVQLVIMNFSISILPLLDIDALADKITENISWIDFLRLLDFYETVEISSEHKYSVLWPPKGGIGQIIEINGEKNANNKKFIQLNDTFESLKKLDKEEKKEILKRFLEFSSEEYSDIIEYH